MVCNLFVKYMKIFMTIIQIVPRLPPAIDGVGDYALNLARQLRKNYGINTNFVVGDYNWNGGTNIDGFPVSKMTAHSASELLSLLSEDISTVLLHYVGYGYAKRGCPIWLVEGLERWKSSIANARLVTMFHEISASGSIWTSAFWLSKLQTNLAARLVQLSDRTITSKELYAKILHQLRQGKQTRIPTLAVFSNVGEPERVPLLAQRHRQLVIFGGYSNRLRVYRQSLAKLELVCHQLEIEEILDIGPSIGLSFKSVNRVPIVEMGQQPAAQISHILLNSIAGFLDYNPDFLGKSTIFSAYCAHGLLPISAQSSTLPIDGIEPGKHYLLLERIAEYKSGSELQAIADNAYIWYQTHNLSVQAQIFAESLTSTIEKASACNLEKST